MPVLLRHSRHITGRSRSEAKQLQGTKQPRAKQPRKQNRRAADASLTAKSRKHTGENIGVGMVAVTYSSSLGRLLLACPLTPASLPAQHPSPTAPPGRSAPSRCARTPAGRPQMQASSRAPLPRLAHSCCSSDRRPLQVCPRRWQRQQQAGTGHGRPEWAPGRRRRAVTPPKQRDCVEAVC